MKSTSRGRLIVDLSPGSAGESPVVGAYGGTDAGLPLGLTFDDVLLLPAESDVVPSHVDPGTRL